MLNKIKDIFKTQNSSNASFESAKEFLYPRIRPKEFMEVYEASIWETTGLQENLYELFFVEFDSNLSIGAVIQKEGKSNILSMSDIRNMNVDINTFMDQLIRNFYNKLPQQPFLEAESGLWQSRLQNMDDASLLYHKDFIKQLDVQGFPVAFIPSRSHTFITGSNDIENLSLLIDESTRLIQQHGSVSGQPYILIGDKWEKFTFDDDHPLAFTFKKLIYLNKELSYKAYAENLQRAGSPLELAEFTALASEDEKSIVSHTVFLNAPLSYWIPKTDFITIAEFDEKDETTIVLDDNMIPWEEFATQFGDRIVKLDTHNEYWEVIEE